VAWRTPSAPCDIMLAYAPMLSSGSNSSGPPSTAAFAAAPPSSAMATASTLSRDRLSSLRAPLTRCSARGSGRSERACTESPVATAIDRARGCADDLNPAHNPDPNEKVRGAPVDDPLSNSLRCTRPPAPLVGCVTAQRRPVSTSTQIVGGCCARAGEHVGLVGAASKGLGLEMFAALRAGFKVNNEGDDRFEPNRLDSLDAGEFALTLWLFGKRERRERIERRGEL
jgi:hypothetical protein